MSQDHRSRLTRHPAESVDLTHRQTRSLPSCGGCFRPHRLTSEAFDPEGGTVAIHSMCHIPFLKHNSLRGRGEITRTVGGPRVTEHAWWHGARDAPKRRQRAKDPAVRATAAPRFCGLRHDQPGEPRRLPHSPFVSGNSRYHRALKGRARAQGRATAMRGGVRRVRSPPWWRRASARARAAVVAPGR